MANRIKELRKQRKITLQQLSEQTGISVSSLSAYENNRRSPKIENWIKLADFFNVPVSYIQGMSLTPYLQGINDGFMEIVRNSDLIDNDAVLKNISKDQQEKVSESVMSLEILIGQLLSASAISADKVYREYLNTILNFVKFLSLSIYNDEVDSELLRKKVMRCYIELIDNFYQKVHKSDVGYLVLENEDDRSN